MFFLGEYGNMTIVGAIVTSLFLGGWAGPGVAFLTTSGMADGWQVLGSLLGILYFIGKVYLLIGVFIWVQGTLPRLRSDQLMQFAWLVLMPVGLGNILLTAMLYLLLNSLGAPIAVFLIVVGVVNWTLLFLFVRWISHVTNISTRKASAPALHAQQRRVQHVEQLAVPIGAIAKQKE